MMWKIVVINLITFLLLVGAVWGITGVMPSVALVGLFGAVLVLQAVLVGVIVLKPVLRLSRAVRGIDFNKLDSTPIDFTMLDELKSDNSDIGVLTKQFKHLTDALCTRITSLNNEVDKSTHDALSGCLNVGYWNDHKDEYASNKTICIIFLDVNNLKKMNDIHGHEAGDNLIKAASAKLAWWKNKGDVYRMGGDEFMIVITNKSRDMCSKWVSEWYLGVGRLNPVSDDFACVFSLGVAYGTQFCNMEVLRKLADDRMYAHKVKIKQTLNEPMR